jgi:hypothetical protein
MIEKNNDPQGYADSQFVGTWKITAVTADVSWDWDGNGSAEKDIYNTWSTCQKDNLYTFVGDKTGTFKLNCSVTNIGFWQIVDTIYLVYIPLGQSPESEKIVSMTSVQFKSVLELTLSNGLPANITKTWVRQ